MYFKKAFPTQDDLKYIKFISLNKQCHLYDGIELSSVPFEERKSQKIAPIQKVLLPSDIADKLQENFKNINDGELNKITQKMDLPKLNTEIEYDINERKKTKKIQKHDVEDEVFRHRMKKLNENKSALRNLHIYNTFLSQQFMFPTNERLKEISTDKLKNLEEDSYISALKMQKDNENIKLKKRKINNFKKEIRGPQLIQMKGNEYVSYLMNNLNKLSLKDPIRWRKQSCSQLENEEIRLRNQIAEKRKSPAFGLGLKIKFDIPVEAFDNFNSENLETYSSGKLKKLRRARSVIFQDMS